jgi:HNH endonuclease
MKAYIPDTLRRQVAERARYCCEYCRIPERFLATFFHIDHVRSRKHGGKTDLDNLAYTCPHCNQHKGSDVATFADEDSDELVRFYNPRRDDWATHFSTEQGDIQPNTRIGEATVRILDFNQPERLLLRRALARIGQYPLPD